MSVVVPVVLATYDQVFNTPGFTVTTDDVFSLALLCDQKVAALPALSWRWLFVPCLVCREKKRRGTC